MYNNKEKLVEMDLEWLYCESESELGIKSNWQACVNVSMGTATSWIDPYHESVLQAVNRRREIETVLSSLSELERETLHRSFCGATLPPSVKKLLERYAGSASLLVSGSLESFLQLCNRVSLGTASPTESIAFHNLKMRAILNYNASIDSYISKKKQNRRKQ